MKAKTISKDTIFSMSLVGVGIVALYLGLETYSRYPTIVQGIQGLTTVYLLYLIYFPPNNFVRNPTGVQLEFPKIIKYIVRAFFIYVIIVWSAQYLIDIILYFLRT